MSFSLVFVRIVYTHVTERSPLKPLTVDSEYTCPSTLGLEVEVSVEEDMKMEVCVSEMRRCSAHGFIQLLNIHEY